MVFNSESEHFSWRFYWMILDDRVTSLQPFNWVLLHLFWWQPWSCQPPESLEKRGRTGGGGWLARVTLVETNIAMEIPSLDRFPFGKSETCTMIPQSSPENGKHAPWSLNHPLKMGNMHHDPSIIPWKWETCTMIPQSSPENGKHAPWSLNHPLKIGNMHHDPSIIPWKWETCTMIPQSSPENGKHAPWSLNHPLKMGNMHHDPSIIPCGNL